MIKKPFRMSKHDLKARPIYHHERELIGAHLTVAAVPVIPLNIYQYSVLWNSKVQGMEGYGSRLGANSDDTKKFYKLAWLKA